MAGVGENDSKLEVLPPKTAICNTAKLSKNCMKSFNKRDQDDKPLERGFCMLELTSHFS
jgi:hypothetical protein